MRHRLWAAAALVLAAGSSQAQVARPFALQTYQPPPAGDPFLTVEDAAAPGHLATAAALTAGLAIDPLVLDLNGTVGADGHLVRRAAWGQAQASLGLGSRFLLGLTAPVALWQSGQQPLAALPRVEASGLGDLSVLGRLTLLERPGLRLAGGAEVYLPTGARGAFASDGAVRVRGSAIAGGERGAWSFGAEVGLLWRPSRDLVVTHTGPALAWSAALAWRSGRWSLGPELYGRFQPSGSSTSPVEALLDTAWGAGAWRVSLGLGGALDRAVGAAAARAVVRVAWRPQPAAPRMPRPDRDGDGVPDDEDACPDEVGLPSSTAAWNGCPLPAPPPAPTPRPPRPAPAPAPALAREAPPEPPGEAPREGPGGPAVRLAGGRLELLRPVLFASSGDALLPESEPLLREVADLLQAHRELDRVRVEGHTDTRGTPAQNMELSVRRAAAVRRWLVEKGGVEPSRLESQGFGQTQPVASNATIQGRAMNRRIELRILEKGR